MDLISHDLRQSVKASLAVEAHREDLTHRIVLEPKLLERGETVPLGK
jgi:hypothetical protein